jgi:hypothetical protein
MVMMQSRVGTTSITVPKFQPTLWEIVVSAAADPDACGVARVKEFEYVALYQDEVRFWVARYVKGRLTEEHVIKSFPVWEIQKEMISRVFEREMIQDDSQPPEEGTIFVKPVCPVLNMSMRSATSMG